MTGLFFYKTKEVEKKENRKKGGTLGFFILQPFRDLKQALTEGRMRCHCL